MARPPTTAMLWAGLALLVAGAPSFAWLHQRNTDARRDHEARARQRDRTLKRLSLVACTIQLRGVETDGRVRRVGEAFNIAVLLSNAGTSSCTTQLAVSASSFDLAPATPMDIQLSQGDRRVLWNLTPRTAGEQAIIVAVGNEQREVGFYVEDSELLPEWALLAGSVASFLFGPMLTVPWWVERRRRQREKAEADAREAQRNPVGFQ